MCSCLDAAVARGEQRAVEQRRADAVALPGAFDAERGLGLAREGRSQRAQFGCAPQHAVDEKPVHHRAQPEGRADVVADEFVRHAAAEPAVAAVGVEPQQVVAVLLGFAHPELADDAAVGEGFLHSGLLTLTVQRPSVEFHSLDAGSRSGQPANQPIVALQHKYGKPGRKGNLL